ncbi:MAG: hypothetical protein Q8L45_12085 [Xanthomonadaceae bacterium]|nr:hypothetical protein [Xanthomonadaceae bacterium]MDP2184942.1 hypothetical protein [Xanthomonadales bacterium]MDZ4115943.1 hypothetical protein [Xanthomonadaceae bacterium]MDZ4378147.1 hypothetical protein [Xanthomonadaceae bacterium]
MHSPKWYVHAALAVCAVSVFFAVGLPYWRIPYAQVALPSALYGFGLVALAALAALMRGVFATAFASTALILGTTVPAAVLARIAYEVFIDPTAHNLWPLELIIGYVIAIASSAFGGSARRIAQR